MTEKKGRTNETSKQNGFYLKQNPVSVTFVRIFFFPFFFVCYFSLYDENTDTWLLGFSHVLPKELKVLQSKVEVCIKI